MSKGIVLPKLCSDDEFITDSVLGPIRITRSPDLITNELKHRLDWRLSNYDDMFTVITETREPHAINAFIDHLRHMVKNRGYL